MSQCVHSINSDDSNDSLPDLHTRVIGKLTKSQPQPSVHTVSDDDENDDIGSFDEKHGFCDEKDCYEDNHKNLYIIEEFTQSTNTLRKELPNLPFRKSAPRDLMSSDPFEESLPDIQNFTILTSGLDHDDDDEKVVENGLDYEVDEKDEQINKRKPKKMRSEEVREEKEAKRLEREMLKQQRAQEKAEAKVLKEAEKTSRRAMKPGTCLMYVRVQLDRHLLEHPDASQVISHLVAAEIKFEIVDSPVSCTATVVRIDPLSMQETLAEDAVILLPVVKFIELVERQIYHNGIAGLIHQCKQWKMELGNPRLTLVVAGIQNYFRSKKTNKNNDFRNAVLGENAQPKWRKKKGEAGDYMPVVNRIDVETALVMAQLECGISHRLFSDAEKVALYITQITKSLAEAPSKWEKQNSSFGWYAEGSSTNCVKIDKSGIGLSKLWIQQLQQFNNAGPEVAQAIAREYPSPQALIQAYQHSPSEKEASLLLAKIAVRRGIGPLVSTRCIGPELSKKIHLFLTTTDPEINLGQK